VNDDCGPADGDCVPHRIEALGQPAWGTGPPPWAPGYREGASDTQQCEDGRADGRRRLVLLSKIDILAGLSEPEMNRIVDAAPARTYHAGELLYTPHRPVEVLFLLKRGWIRVFRVSPEGRALTTAIVSPGTMFGEMVLLGQRMYDNYAEALDEAYTCVMDQADARRLLLSDPRIAARIVEILGRRLADMEKRLSDAVFSNVSQRVAAALCALAAGHPVAAQDGATCLTVTHSQVAELAGTSRETATKALGELAGQGLLRLGRGRITITDRSRLADCAGPS
jgi:CRP/FNR family cyclic AMP-dependent transcriptional regulator